MDVYNVRNISTDWIYVSHQKLSITGATVQRLTVPTTANYALVRYEADATATDTTRIVRVLFGGESPTTTEGMPFGNLESHSINEKENLENYRVLSIESSKTTIATILYFK